MRRDRRFGVHFERRDFARDSCTFPRNPRRHNHSILQNKILPLKLPGRGIIKNRWMRTRRQVNRPARQYQQPCPITAFDPQRKFSRQSNEGALSRSRQIVVFHAHDYYALRYCEGKEREDLKRKKWEPNGLLRLPANRVLQERIGHLLTRPVGRTSNEVRRSYANFTYQAGSWAKPHRVIAKVEWHPGELYPRAGFIVTNMARFAENVVAFYNKRGTCEQWIKEGKGAIKWTRLSCRSFAANAVRLQLHALAYNLGNFLRTLATPDPIKDWSLTSLKEKLIKIGAKVVSHGRYVAFQTAEVAIPRNLFADIVRLIAELRPPRAAVST